MFRPSQVRRSKNSKIALTVRAFQDGVIKFIQINDFVLFPGDS